jgi:CheY-like chemotaxis protein
MRILIVDGNKIALTVLRRALKHSRHEGLTAGDGNQALALMRGNPCPIPRNSGSVR